MITESVSATGTAITKTHSTSFLVSTANTPNAPPNPKAPTSPMKTDAGFALYQRKPTLAPAIADATMAKSCAPSTLGIIRYLAISKVATVLISPTTTGMVKVVADRYASKVQVPAPAMTGPIASPSRPSVRFRALDAPTMTNEPKITYAQRGICSVNLSTLTNGMVTAVLKSGTAT